MLYVDYNTPDDKILWNPGIVFDLYYEKSWFEDPEVVRIACEIDNLHHTCDDIFEHEITGRCSGLNLSGGAKTLILAYVGVIKDKVYQLSWLGENCYSVLGSLNIDHDVVFDADSMPNLDKFYCTFKSLKTGKLISNLTEYYDEVCRYVFNS